MSRTDHLLIVRFERFFFLLFSIIISISTSSFLVNLSLWQSDDDAFLDETLGDEDRTMTGDTTLPSDVRGSCSDFSTGCLPDGSIELYKSFDIADASLPSLNSLSEDTLSKMRSLSIVDDDVEGCENDTLVEQSLLENTFFDTSVLDSTIVDKSVFESTKIDFDNVSDVVDSFVSGFDDTFHAMDKSALTTTFTDVSQLSALSSLPSAPSSSGSDGSSSEVEKLETFL